MFAGSDNYGAGTSSDAREKENIDKSTILHADLPSSDDEDSDFDDSDLEEDEGDAEKSEAGPSFRVEVAGTEEGEGVAGDNSEDNTSRDSAEDEEDGGNSSEDYIDDDDDASLDLRELGEDHQGEAGPSEPRNDSGIFCGMMPTWFSHSLVKAECTKIPEQARLWLSGRFCVQVRLLVRSFLESDGEHKLTMRF